MRAAAFPLGAAVTLAELEHDPHPVLARLQAAFTRVNDGARAPDL